MNCSVGDCIKIAEKRGLCGMHYRRWQRHGDVHAVAKRRKNGTGTVMKSGHISLNVSGRPQYEHVITAERALGHELPDGAQVHHVDLNPSNNDSDNLVICPSDAYHKLLHRRQRALNECGNADHRKCWVCKRYDAPENLTGNDRRIHHAECIRAYDRRRYAERDQHA